MRVRGRIVAADDDDLTLRRLVRDESGETYLHPDVAPAENFHRDLLAVQLENGLAGFGTETFARDIYDTAAGGIECSGEYRRIDGKNFEAVHNGAVVSDVNVQQLALGIHDNVQVAKRNSVSLHIAAEDVGLVRQPEIHGLNLPGVHARHAHTGLRKPQACELVVRGVDDEIERLFDRYAAVVAQPDAIAWSHLLLGMPRIDKSDGEQLHINAGRDHHRHIDPRPATHLGQPRPHRIIPAGPGDTRCIDDRLAEIRAGIVNRTAHEIPAPVHPRRPMGEPAVMRIEAGAAVEVSERLTGVERTHVADEPMLPAALPGQAIGQLHAPAQIAMLVELKLFLEINLPRDAGIDEMIEFPGFQPFGRRGDVMSLRHMWSADTRLSHER